MKGNEHLYQIIDSKKVDLYQTEITARLNLNHSFFKRKPSRMSDDSIEAVVRIVQSLIIAEIYGPAIGFERSRCYAPTDEYNTKFIMSDYFEVNHLSGSDALVQGQITLTLLDKLNWSEEAKSELVASSVNILSRSLMECQKTGKTTGLVVGYVQSG